MKCDRCGTVFSSMSSMCPGCGKIVNKDRDNHNDIRQKNTEKAKLNISGFKISSKNKKILITLAIITVVVTGIRIYLNSREYVYIEPIPDDYITIGNSGLGYIKVPPELKANWISAKNDNYYVSISPIPENNDLKLYVQNHFDDIKGNNDNYYEFNELKINQYKTYELTYYLDGSLVYEYFIKTDKRDVHIIIVINGDNKNIRNIIYSYSM